MSVNLDDLTFKYTVKPDGSVDYIANADGKIQNLSNRNTSSQDDLEADLASYTQAYVSGLRLDQTTIGNDLRVGSQQTADAAPGA